VYCQWCLNSKEKNVLAKGTDQFQKQTLECHEKLEAHVRANPDLKNRPIFKIAIDVNQAAIMNLIRGCLYIVKNLLPYNTFEDLSNLLEKVKAIIPRLFYRDANSCTEIIECISNYIEESIAKKLEKTIAFGILAGESTDIVLEEHVIYYAQYYDESDFKIRSSFLKLIKIPDKKGLAIYKAFIGLCNSKKINISKLVAACTDDASNMSGAENGVIGLLRKASPALTYCHCVSRRLLLVLNEALSDMKYLVQYEGIIIKTKEFKGKKD